MTNSSARSDTRTALYRFFDSDGDLLYIGAIRYSATALNHDGREEASV